jgi:hypothetical protein
MQRINPVAHATGRDGEKMSLNIYLIDPKCCPHCGGIIPGEAMELFARNYTHNVVPMWKKAGVYEALYKSEGHRAGEYIEAMERGVADMKANFSEYEKLDSPNGWGLAKNAMPWLEDVTEQFKKYPHAVIHVSV